MNAVSHTNDLLFYLSIVLLLLISISFIVLERTTLAVWQLVLACSLLFISFASIVATRCVNPGHMPKDTDILEADAAADLVTDSTAATTSDRPYPFTHTKSVDINGNALTIKYCVTCRSWREPRAHHCSVCDACVLKGTLIDSS